MSVKSMHTALMEMAQNQSEAVAYNTKAAKSRLDDRRETNSRMLKRDFNKSGISHIHSTKTGPDGSKYDHFDIGKHTKVISTHNSYKVLHKGKETHYQGDPEHRDNRNRVIDKVLQHVGKNESVKSMRNALMEMEQNQLDEKVSVEKKKYNWGLMMTVKDGKSNTFPLHPEEQAKIKKLKDGQTVKFKDETGAQVTAARKGDMVHLSNKMSNKKTPVAYSNFTESFERAAWVPESIADEQVEAFMEAALAAVQEGEDTFVFEGKHYKAKPKKEAKKLDPVGKADADIDNDGDVDSSDEYLKKRRAAIKKSMDEAEEMDPTKHVSKKGDMYCVYNKDGEEVAKFDNEEEANAYARKNHDTLMGKKEMDEAAAPGSTAQHGPDADTTDSYTKQLATRGGEKEFVDMHNMEVGMDIEKVTDQNKESMEKALKQTPARMGDQRTGDTSFVNPIKADIIDGITKALQQMKSNS